MCGDASKGGLFSYIDLEKRVRADHPVRLISDIANAALKSLSRSPPVLRFSVPV